MDIYIHIDGEYTQTYKYTNTFIHSNTNIHIHSYTYVLNMRGNTRDLNREVWIGHIVDVRVLVRCHFQHMFTFGE